MPPDRPPLPSSVLAALGLVAASGCGPCLDVAACLDYAVTHSGLPEHSGVGPCLAPTDPTPPHTGEAHTAEPHTGDSGGSGGHSGAAARAPAPRAPAVFERLATEGVLPPDVVERLSRRGR